MNQKKFAHVLIFWCVISSVALLAAAAHASVQRVKYQAQGNYLVVEVLDDDLIHFEYGTGDGPDTGTAIETSDMICRDDDAVPSIICKTDFSGPTVFTDDSEGVINTKDLKLVIDRQSLLISIIDTSKQDLLLTTLRAINLHQNFKGLLGTRQPDLDVYGLGQQFVESGNTDIDWEGRIRTGGPFGNVMAGFNGGANGNTQIPIMYAVNGATLENYALFLDNKYKHTWDFTSSTQWKVEVADGALRFFVMSGQDLLDLRKDYMQLVGHPLVPPKKMFGLWVSEYGYDDWNEMEEKLTTLRNHDFPLDGFVLDLQWFGGIKPHSDDTRMGSLSFDLINFPNPQSKIASYRENHGVGIMLIEEAYVGRALPEHADLHRRACLATDRPGATKPAYITSNPWWGKGGMIDYTNDVCGAYIHDNKRVALIDNGVIGHWTDLGEPEMFNPGSGYSVGNHAAAHNIFNFRWIRSIAEGYQRHSASQRPFMMSRSGTAGIQRFGAAMWSGDIGAKLSNLSAHAANQMHMSFSGIDYYGADIGGFHRGGIQGDRNRKNEMYTQWYAAGMMFDVPGRPHTENLCNCKETAPDKLGHLQSNLENTRLRYQLSPYLYSLAHRAYLYGEPVMPPLVMYYQTDNNVRHRGREKMIGRDLLAAFIAEHGRSGSDVYLPAGTWIDWHSHRRFASQGVVLPNVPLYRDGLFRVPLFARTGTIVPLAHVDEKTMNSEGKRKDGVVRNELIAKVFAVDREDTVPYAFTLYEDDEKTVAYQQGEVRTTEISQVRNADQLTVQVSAAHGRYQGASDSRDNVIKLVTNDPVIAVQLNEQALTEFTRMEAFDGAGSGWIAAGKNMFIAKSGVEQVASDKTFIFTLTKPRCTSQFDSISLPGAGNGWNPADPQRTFGRESCDQKVWSGQVTMCNEPYKFAANQAWTTSWGCDGTPNGPNCPPKAAGVYNVSFDENDPVNPRFERIADASACGSVRFVCENGHTTWGTSVYVVGNISELGGWDPNKAELLTPTGPYPTWVGSISDLPEDTSIEWKCIKRQEGGDQRVIQWEPGANNIFDKTKDKQVGVF